MSFIFRCHKCKKEFDSSIDRLVHQIKEHKRAGGAIKE